MSSGEIVAGLERQIGARTATEVPPRTPRPLVLKAEFLAPCEVDRNQCLSTPSSTITRRSPATPSPSKGREDGPADDLRIVGHRSGPARSTCWPIMSRRKRGLAGDRRAVDGAEAIWPTMPRATRGSKITVTPEPVSAWRGLSFLTARSRGLAAEFGGRHRDRHSAAAVALVVALHRRAFAGNDADMPRPKRGCHIGAGEAVRGDEHQAAHRRGRAGAAELVTPAHGKRRRFHLERRIRSARADETSVGSSSAEIGVGRGRGRHRRPGRRRDLPARPWPWPRRARPAWLQVEARIGRNAGDALADEDAQREIVALGGLVAFDLAEAHGDGAGARRTTTASAAVGARLAGAGRSSSAARSRRLSGIDGLLT